MQSPIHALLEQIATTDIDFDQKCFERFFQISEEGKTLMAHMDRVHRGKMMAEIYRLMMARDLDDEADYLNWEAQNHETAYFVPLRILLLRHWTSAGRRRTKTSSPGAVIKSLPKFNPDIATNRGSLGLLTSEVIHCIVADIEAEKFRR